MFFETEERREGRDGQTVSSRDGGTEQCHFSFIQFSINYFSLVLVLFLIII